jgi:SulP family sulfate permease
MAIVVVVLADAVERVAMPALAGLLIVVGFGTVKPAKVLAVARTGQVPLTVMAMTFVLTLVIPLQYAVLVGVGLSVLLFVIGQSSRLVLRRIEILDDGRWRETDPPDVLPPGEVVVVQPYGPIFFATASVLREQLPDVADEPTRSVVILRIRGADEAGATMLDVLREYARSLNAVGSRLAIVTDNRRLVEQLHETGTAAVIGADHIRASTEFIGESLEQAHADALEWIGDAAVDGDTT